MISVVLPLFNGSGLLERAITSLQKQSFADWECLIVDDASTDEAVGVMATLATSDTRLRTIHFAHNRGVSAARNAALARARGEWVAYLDHDDEFYPDHLARIRRRADDDADVLVFRYDLIEERPGHPRCGQTFTHDPATLHDKLFLQHIAVPLGVAHRRRVTEHTGGFDERRRRDEDSELWMRFALAGAVFTFVAETSGLYHIRARSASRSGPGDPPLSPRPAPSPLPWRSQPAFKAPEHPASVPPVPSTASPAQSVDTVAVEVVFGTDRRTLQLPPNDASGVGRIFERGDYAGIPHDVLSNPPTVVDVGGRYGEFANYARLAWHPEAKVHSFEPDPPRVNLLRRNTADFAEVTVHPFGLGISDRTSDSFQHAQSKAGHSTAPGSVGQASERVPLPIRDAAAIWEELGLGEIDVLKIDAEGAETAILERLGPRLSRVRVLLIGYHTDSGRRRVDAMLPWHLLFGAVVRSPRSGTLKYIRADLVAESAGPPAPVRADHPRVMFVSYHCFEDPTSGAALCTHDLFDLLTARGWSCEVFTGPQLDSTGTPLGEREGATTVSDRAEGIPFTESRYKAPAGYPVTVFAPDPPVPGRPPTADEAKAFGARLDEAVRRFHPDIVLLYGGDAASRSIPAIVRSFGAKAVFWLHNYAYSHRDPFRECDAVIVPSADCREHYRSLGVEAAALPGPWNWGRLRCGQIAPKYVTFVNPEPVKGVFWFARIAEVLGRLRPDIPLLVVEGRGKVDWLARCGLDLGGSNSLRRMQNTADPTRFYRLSRLVLVPSLWREALSRVAVEAMANGIPVIGSGRGGLGEVLAAGGIRVEIPSRFTPESRTPPNQEEVGEWVAEIIRLWDDPEEYSRASASAKAAAERIWHPDVLGPQWFRFLEALVPTPGR